MTVRTEFRVYKNVFVDIRKYMVDESLAVALWNREDGPIAMLTVRLVDDSLGENEAYVDTNNCSWAMKLIEEYKLGRSTGRTGHSGYCTYPVVRFDMNRLKELEA